MLGEGKGPAQITAALGWGRGGPEGANFAARPSLRVPHERVEGVERRSFGGRRTQIREPIAVRIGADSDLIRPGVPT
jgi:hypothetical protein